MSFMQQLGKALEVGLNVAVAYQRQQEFSQLLSLDRKSAMDHMEWVTRSYATQQLDQFEADFLNYATSIALSTPQARRRAMELYAWLKICELAHYQEFRGFA